MRWLAVLTIVLLPASTWAQAARPAEDLYQQIQQAFLQEQFDRVIVLAPSLREELDAAARRELAPGELGRRGRAWLWYALSLDRLQRSPEALAEVDRLREQLQAMAAARQVRPEPAAMDAFTDGLWPELLFWDGEISRKAYQMMRARRAYQRVLADFPKSSWRPQAQLGLAFVLFHQQSYEDGLRQAQEVQRATLSPLIRRQARLLEGLANLQLKRFDPARMVFEDLLKTAADRPAASQMAFYVGESLSGLNRFPEASRAYLQSMEADPGSTWARLARFGLGWSVFQQRQYALGAEVFGVLLKGDPSWPRPEFWFAHGRCLLEIGDDAAAQQRFEALLAHTTEHPLAIEAALSLSELLERQQRVADAVALIQPLTQRALTPDQRTRLALRLGSLSLLAGQTQSAAEQFVAAADSADPQLRQAALSGQGDVRFATGDVDGAAQAYERAMAVDPKADAAAYARYQLGRVRLQQGRLVEAIDEFRAVASTADRDLSADARLALAFAYVTNHQPDLARVEVDVVRHRSPGSPQAGRAGYYLALVSVREGRVDEAVGLCRGVIERVPYSDEAVEARLLLADLSASRDSAGEALAQLRGSVAGTAVGSADLTTNQRGRLAKKLGDLAEQARNYTDAIAWYEQARLLLTDRQGELDYRLASCYEEAGDFEPALARYRSIQHAPWTVRGQLAAAKLLERQQRWPEARAAYQAVAKQRVPEAKIAQERLDEMSEGSSTRPGKSAGRRR
jgi:tetratricopeptide (TPR) repeat protein